MVVLLVLVGLGVAWLLLAAYVNAQVRAGIERKMHEVQRKADQERAETLRVAEEERRRTAAEGAAAVTMVNERIATLKQMEQAFAASYVQGRKWLADFIADAFQAQAEGVASYLEVKKNPAIKSADEIRQIAKDRRQLTVRLKQTEYSLRTICEYYPAIEQYLDDILNEEATLDVSDGGDGNLDAVSRFVSQEQYNRLKPVERNQLALDNWRARKKSSVEIGRIYERFLGYLYEQDGWTVTFFGALAGLEDMGRDLVCVRDNVVHVVQAKYWAKHKTIHEKHIFQLHGTALLLPLTHPDLKGKTITPVFAATTGLSDTAQWAAKSLGVTIRALDMDRDYPVIKCNVNGGSKIYHLPFDQQYDRVRIIPKKGERYVSTVAEAERLGFRRAMRSAYGR